MDKREVTEFDLRAEEFKNPNTKPEDLEFRSDGKIVRKDRFQRGFQSLVEPAGFSLRDFEIDDVVSRIQGKLEALENIDHYYILHVLRAAMKFMPRDSNNEDNVTVVRELNDAIQIVEGVAEVLSQVEE